MNLELETKATPVYFPPRPVAFALKEDVEKEIGRLVANGTISSIESSKWGTPLVPIMKTDVKLRICGDYEVTLNKFLVDSRHPVPRIEDIFASLRKGEKFSKLDMPNAFNQFELSYESKLLAAWSTHKGFLQRTDCHMELKWLPENFKRNWKRFC